MIDAALLNNIYASGTAPDRWPALLVHLAQFCGATCGAMFQISQWRPAVFAPPFPIGLAHPFDHGALGDHRGTTRAGPFDQASGHAGYGGLILPAERSASVWTVIQGVPNRPIALTLNGFSSESDARAILPKLDLLRPHLERAAGLAGSIADAKAQASVDSLDLAGTPAAILTKDGYVRAANTRFTASIRNRATIREGRLRFHRADVNVRIAAALAGGGGERAITRHITLPAFDDLDACILGIYPLRSGRTDAFSDSDDFVLVAVDPGNRVAPKLDLVRQLFDLTVTEATLAIELAAGRSLQEVAAARGIAYATARVHLRSIFAKTGCARQAELVALLHVPGLGFGG